MPAFQRSSQRLPLLVIILLVAVLSAACTTVATVSPDATNQENNFSNLRAQQLAVVQSWRFKGRFSLVTESEAWSGKMHWIQQSDSEYLIQFSDPAGQGAMQLIGNGELAELRLANGDSYQAADADALMRQETDWDLPIKSLWYWVRGLPDPGLPKKVSLDEQGLYTTLQQNNWVVNYKSYHQGDSYALPRKITVENETLKLRLIVMDWITG